MYAYKVSDNLCQPPAISTVFPINKILYFISIGSILNIRTGSPPQDTQNPETATAQWLLNSK